MAVVAEEVRAAPVEPLPVADPAPLGLAAFALTTFILSGHNATFIPDLIWVGLALFYGGLIQLLAGMWEFRNRNVFGATAFSTYGGVWLALGVFLTLQITEVLLVIGFFLEASGRQPANNWWLHAGGWAGIVTAAVAWYTSAAGVVNGMSPRPVVPVGAPFWGELPAAARRPSPMPRRAES